MQTANSDLESYMKIIYVYIFWKVKKKAKDALFDNTDGEKAKDALFDNADGKQWLWKWLENYICIYFL